MVTRLWPALLCELIETTPGRARHRALDHRGDLLVDRVGRGAVVVGADGDDRAVDIRQFADLDAAEGGDAGDDDEQVEDDREHRTADEERRDARAARQ